METKIFGHRGSAGTHPENTMISFKEAARVGADGIELDVQMTKDGVLVVIHDETVNRTTNGKGWVKDFLFKDLKKLDASHKFKEKVGFCGIPTLEEVFDWVSTQKIKVNVELKTGLVPYKGIEEKTVDMIRNFKLDDRIILSSFNHYSMVTCRQLTSSIDIAILFMEGIYEPWVYAKRIGANSLHPYHPVAKKEMIEEAQKNGFPVRPFTVNDEKKLLQFAENGVSALITDFPERAVRLLK
ncbi:glycerophosphodiester phosphodiesterase [Fredinandcohnia sp. 179-A 10B2 NHS]|uniref:glycerophosphodiester phosphodiesterase n=1 Tax=Fredinandcohnia sp. 179-A 10B2 NHS TaxID=3235176 RepID=UPI00399FB970